LIAIVLARKGVSDGSPIRSVLKRRFLVSATIAHGVSSASIGRILLLLLLIIHMRVLVSWVNRSLGLRGEAWHLLFIRRL
jgi:hypothetical protein